MLLFKDKVNYKLPGANGFVAHIDAPAYEHMGDMKFMEVMVVTDSQRPENGSRPRYIFSGIHPSLRCSS